jgi:SpoVK/Ycf46/Vps4 family AAA+-type ATPase
MKSLSIIFFDEIDAVELSRTESESGSSRCVKTKLFTQIDGFIKNKGIFVMGATNTPHSLDCSLLRLFNKLIYVPLPDKQSRIKMFQ